MLFQNENKSVLNAADVCLLKQAKLISLWTIIHGKSPRSASKLRDNIKIKISRLFFIFRNEVRNFFHPRLRVKNQDSYCRSNNAPVSDTFQG